MISMSGFSAAADDSMWTWQQEKRFEIGLVDFPEETANRWEKIAATLDSKSAEDVEQHYAALVEDIAAIEAGLVELPQYSDSEVGISPPQPNLEKRPAFAHRKSGVPWSEEEHRRFLLGLEKYGRGDWKSISRRVVQSRNPTQVASHAQKYFARQDREDETKKRRSIFDKSLGESSL